MNAHLSTGAHSLTRTYTLMRNRSYTLKPVEDTTYRTRDYTHIQIHVHTDIRINTRMHTHMSAQTHCGAYINSRTHAHMTYKRGVTHTLV